MNPHPKYHPYPTGAFDPDYEPIALVMDITSFHPDCEPLVPRYLPFNPSCRPCESRGFKRKSTSVESSGTAVEHSKQSSSGSEAAGSTYGEKETGGEGGATAGVYNTAEELSGETGQFARKCSLRVGEGDTCGGQSGGNTGRAIGTRMPP